MAALRHRGSTGNSASAKQNNKQTKVTKKRMQTTNPGQPSVTQPAVASSGPPVQPAKPLPRGAVTRSRSTSAPRVPPPPAPRGAGVTAGSSTITVADVGSTRNRDSTLIASNRPPRPRKNPKKKPGGGGDGRGNGRGKGSGKGSGRGNRYGTLRTQGGAEGHTGSDGPGTNASVRGTSPAHVKR